jgi:hypothetical protein
MPDEIPPATPPVPAAPAPRRHSSPRKRAASLKNLEKAWQANRRHWEKTPARMAAARRTIQLAQAAIRGRPRKFSPAQLRAVRANVARARDALAARGRSPEHLAKLRQTIVGARAARTPASFRRQAAKVLKHGLFARSMRETLRPLGEDRKEFARHFHLLRAYFGPRGPQEEKIVRTVVEAVRRRIRLWRAEAYWQSRHLEQLLEMAAPLATPDPELTRHRAMVLMEVLSRQERLFELNYRLLAVLERLLRRLVRRRSGGQLDLKMLAREERRPPDSEEAKLERLHAENQVWARLLDGDPELQAVLDGLRPQWMRERDKRAEPASDSNPTNPDTDKSAE